jgi:hypothetical protein
MKKLSTILILLLLIFCTTAKATECSDRIFREEKINLYLCQNHSDYSEERSLLYKARTKVLNDYIKNKIAEGKLKDKKFEIQIYDRLLTSPQLILTQGKNGYFVTLTGFPSLQQLLTIVDYFSKPDWKPFLAYDYEKESMDDIQRRIDRFHRQNAKSEDFSYSPFTILEKSGVSWEYSGDSLKTK